MSGIDWHGWKRLGPVTRHYKANAWDKLYGDAAVDVLQQISGGGKATITVQEKETERHGGGLQLDLNISVSW
jgi:hypothetical protein